MRVLVELSGEHPTLPEAEVRAVAGLEDAARDGRVLIGEAPDAAPWERLALSHAVGRHLASAPDLDALVDAATSDARFDGVESPFAVRVTAHGGDWHPRRIADRLGQALAAGGRRTVDLQRPESTVRVVGTEDALHAHRLLHDVDRSAFEARRSHLRPFFQPTSLHPRLARAVVNLARPRRRLLDPFCGTGGLVLEAALMGVPAVGGDADPAMVAGTRRNLAHHGGAGGVGLYVGDARALPLARGAVDAVVADPPYGRAAASHGGDPKALQAELLSEAADLLATGDRLVAVLPDPPDPGRAEAAGWRLAGLHAVRVHKSLTRHVAVLVML